MGCDIHAYIEYKNSRRNPWRPYSNPELERDYYFFTAISGVRGYDIKQLFEPKGIPDD